MSFIPRQPIPAVCAYCRTAFEARHLRRKYCCSSCNVLAAQARKKAGAAAELDYSDAASYVVPARLADAIGPVAPVGSYFFPSSDERTWGPAFSETAHAFQAAQPVLWLTENGEHFSRRDFALDTQGTVWLQAYGFDNRWFRVDTIESVRTL